MFDVHATEEEDKLVLLCALSRLGGCTEEQLLRFVVETELITQFRFFLALGELKETELVREARHLEGMLLILTPEGRQSVELFGTQIRASQQQKLDENVKQWRRRIRDEQQMPADWKETDNGFVVTLRALEGGLNLVDCLLEEDTCGKSCACPSRIVWMKIRDGLNQIVDSITLQDMINDYERLSAQGE